MNKNNRLILSFLSLNLGKSFMLLILLAISPILSRAQLGPCPSTNNTSPPFTTADALNPNYGATLEIDGSILFNNFPSFCVDDDPSDGKATEGGCATFLFTGLPNQDSCEVLLFFRPREGCSTIGNPPMNICLWQEDPANPGQWLSLGSAENDIIPGDAAFLIPAGSTEFSITLCGPNANSSVLLWGVLYDLPYVDLGPDTSICVFDVPTNIDLTLHEPVNGYYGSNQTGGRWEEIGVGTITTPDNYPLNGSLGDSFSFEYSFEDIFNQDCIVKDTIVYTITNDCPNVPQVTLSGTSNTWNGETVDNVTYTAINAAEQTTGSPNYSFTLFTGGNEDIKAERNTDPIPLVGITTLDILLTRAHILQTPLLSNPYQLLAADVNASGNISTSDYLQMQAMILQNISAFQPGNRLWAFTSSDYTFPDPQNPWSYDPFRHYTPLSAPDKIDQDFTGIKLGDVNGSWTAAGGNRISGIPHEVFSIDDQSAEQGTRIRVPIIAKDFKDLSGYQFTLEWDPGILQYEQVISASLTGEYGYTATNPGYLNALWYDNMAQSVSLASGDILFEVEFTLIGSKGSSTNVSISSASIPAEAYNAQFEVLELKSVSANIQEGQTTSVYELQEGYELGLANPNPFSTQITIPFTLPKSEIIQVEIFNLLGQEVWNLYKQFDEGEQKIIWDRKNSSGQNLPPGIYHLRIKLGSERYTLQVLARD